MSPKTVRIIYTCYCVYIHGRYNTTSQFDKYKDDYVKLYINLIKTVVNEEHPSGIFLSSSPSNAAESEKEGWVAQNPYDTKYGDGKYIFMI